MAWTSNCTEKHYLRVLNLFAGEERKTKNISSQDETCWRLKAVLNNLLTSGESFYDLKCRSILRSMITAGEVDFFVFGTT